MVLQQFMQHRRERLSKTEWHYSLSVQEKLVLVWTITLKRNLMSSFKGSFFIPQIEKNSGGLPRLRKEFRQNITRYSN